MEESLAERRQALLEEEVRRMKQMRMVDFNQDRFDDEVNVEIAVQVERMSRVKRPHEVKKFRNNPPQKEMNLKASHKKLKD